MGKIDNPHKPPLDQIKKAIRRIRSAGAIPSTRPVSAQMQRRIAAIRAKRRRIFV